MNFSKFDQTMIEFQENPVRKLTMLSIECYKCTKCGLTLGEFKLICLQSSEYAESRFKNEISGTFNTF